MKKIVIASDSHGSARALRRILAAEPDAWALVFLGDGWRDLEGLQEEFPHLKLYWVLGNCDFTDQGPEEGLLPCEGVLFYYTHGDRWHVKYGLASLANAAGVRGADVALFGHTHVPTREQLGGVTLFNPGSVGRAFNGQPTYGVALCQNGRVELEHRRVPALWDQELGGSFET